MTSLMGLLDMGAGALVAQSAGVAVSGRNAANVNTRGYSRESVDLNALPGAPVLGGVTAGGVPIRAANEILGLRERLNDGERGQSGALAEALLSLEGDLTPASGNLSSAITNLFGGLIDFAAAPLDSSVRGDVVSRGTETAQSFAAAAASVSRSRSDADARLGAQASTATILAAQIAAANKALAGPQPDPTLLDQRDVAARQLAEITGGQARIGADGQMRFLIGGGTVLVDGSRPAQLRAVPDAANGNHFKLEVADGSHVTDVTASLSGKMGGDAAFRDGAAAQAAADLDRLAFDVATQINGVHRANAGTDGVAGRDFFVQPTQVAGAAAAMAIDPQLAADRTRLAGAAAGAPSGDNQGALALLALKDQALAGGGSRSFGDEALRTIVAVGSAGASARSTNQLAVAKSDTLASIRDSVSGVSQEEELARLAQFQHAHEAAAKFVSVVNDMLSNLMDVL